MYNIWAVIKNCKHEINELIEISRHTAYHIWMCCIAHLSHLAAYVGPHPALLVGKPQDMIIGSESLSKGAGTQRFVDDNWLQLLPLVAACQCHCHPTLVFLACDHHQP